MRRFLAFWIVLTPACWLSMAAVSWFVFRHVDLTYYTFAVLVTAPVLQALVLAAATSAPRAGPLPLRATLRDPLVAPVVLLDLLLIGAGWLWPNTSPIGLTTGASIHPAWLGTKSIVAGAFLLSLAVKWRKPERSTARTQSWKLASASSGVEPAEAGSHNGHGSHDDQRGSQITKMTGADRAARIWLMLGGAAFIAAGLQAFVPWIEPFVTTVLPIGRWPTLFRWIAAYGTMFVGMNALILVTGRILRRRSADADFWMQTAVALNFCVGLIAVHGFFRLPYLVDPWYGLAWTAGSLAASSALLAAIRASGGPSVGEPPAST